MTTGERLDMFEMYDRTVKSWSDYFSNSTRMWGWPSSSMAPPGAEQWFRPWSAYVENWQKMARGFVDMYSGTEAYRTMKDSTEAMAVGIDAYLKLCDSWMKSSEKIAREGMALARQWSAGEKPDTGAFLDAMEAAYSDMSQSVVESMKKTPLSGVKGIDEALRRSREAFPNENEAAREFCQSLFNSAAEAAKAGTVAMSDAARALSTMVEKGTLSMEAYTDLISVYGNALKQSIETLRPAAVLMPGYNEIIADAVEWAKMNVDLSTCWLEMNVRLQKAARDSFVSVYRSAQETLSQSQSPPSADEWVKRWSEAYDRGTKRFVESSDAFKAVPAFVDQYTECLKAAVKVSNGFTRLPFATRAEIERLSKEVEKAKSQAEKAARKAAATSAS